MRLVFAGTPVFAATALDALISAGHDISAVFCQPDRPSGRGKKNLHGPVKQLALKQGLPIFQPLTLKDPETLRWIHQDRAQIWVVAAYGLLLPPEVLASPPLGCLNIHASLLPRWRGAAPIQRAIEAGDLRSGVGIMKMEAGLDTGPVLLEESLDILARDTYETLHDKLAELGAKAILHALNHLETLLPMAKPQASEGVLYASKIHKEEAWLNWARPAVELERQIRAFTPSPGARFRFHEEMIKVGEACVVEAPANLPKDARPGWVLNSQQDLQVLTGEGVLRFSRLQRPGGKMLSIKDFLAGRSLPEGSQLD